MTGLMQEPRPRRSTLKVLGKTVGSECRRYWSIRPEHGVPEKIGLRVWGIMFDTRDQAIEAYKKAEMSVNFKERCDVE